MNRILLVDDDPSIIRLVRQILLRRFGTSIEVHDSRDLADAQRQLAKTAFEVLITDIYLAGKNGLDLILAAKDMNPSLQAIAMTGSPTVELVRYAATHGVSDFWLKPLRPAELIAQLEEALARAERWRLAISGTVCHQFV